MTYPGKRLSIKYYETRLQTSLSNISSTLRCEPEIILVKCLKDSLKKRETNLNGLHGKKFGFREVIEMASARPAYPVSPSLNSIKRNRNSVDSLYGSPDPSQLNGDKENELKKIRLAGSITPSTSEDSNDSVYKPVKTVSIRTKKVKIASGETKFVITEPEMGLEERMVNLRLDRMRAIQTKKPKFSMDNIELTYHSNMARNFPGSEFRTQDQQARRDKNTLAARISRTKNKAYERILQDQSVAATVENLELKRKIACMRVYATELMNLVGYPERNLGEMWEENVQRIFHPTQETTADPQASSSPAK